MKIVKLFSIVLCLILCSCNSNSNKNNEKYISLTNEDGATPYTLIYGNISEEATVYIEEFAYKLHNKCNITLYARTEEYQESEYEILLGQVYNRVQSASIADILMPTNYIIKQVDKKIIVGASSNETIKEGLNKLLDLITKYDNKNWGIKENLEIYGDLNMKTFIPKLTETIGVLDGDYYCENGNYQIGYKDAVLADFDNYKLMYENNNFTKVMENQIGNNYFATYTKESGLVNISFYENQKRLHVLYGPLSYLPNQKIITDKVVTPSITQIGRKGAAQSSAGLSIVVQLSDGSYIIIDGGPEDESDEENLLKFLQDNNPNSDKPKVTWMFTHAHHDHMGLAVSFLEKYHNEIDVNVFCYNFPDFDSIVISSEPSNRIETSKELISKFEEVYNLYYSTVPKYIFHAGDKLQLADCEIEILLTHETFWPNDFPWINHTSSAWTIKIKDTKMMVLGDCESTVCSWMASTYQEELKCDILQVTHHGLNGGDIPFYEYVDADICFWPIDETRFSTSDMCLGTKSGFEYNAYLRDETIKQREHYAATNTTTITID